MSDDHFVVIHVAQRWVDGYDNWFNKEQASHFSIIYPGLHYIFFKFLALIGIHDPQLKMLMVRFIHAVYSLLIVTFGYLITLKLSNKQNAKQVGILLALFWFIPFMSVRNLVEVVCIPPILIGYYLIFLSEEKDQAIRLIFSGFLFGLAFAFRYQTLILTGSIGLVFMIQQKWRPFFYFAAGVLLGSFCLQGLVDWIAWGYPFASFVQYVIHNIDNRFMYVTGPWYRYLILILLVFIPPVSIILIYGAGRLWRKYAVLLLPIIIFVLFHSFFPNKQERFMLPIFPLILITGIIGWNDYQKISGFWRRHRNLLRGFWIWFWVINSILLLLVTFNYSKKSLIEPFNYLSNKKDINGLIIEYDRENLPWFPRFYLTKNIPVFRITPENSIEELEQNIITKTENFPNYILFFGDQSLNERIYNFEKLFRVNLVFDRCINASNIDQILHTLNPKRNLNLTSNIYYIEQTSPK